MLARYYGSSLGRFESSDPGKDTDLEDPQSWNKYTYVRNNPVLLTDPDGHKKIKFDKNKNSKTKLTGTQILHIKEQIARLRKNKRFNKAYKALKKDKFEHVITGRKPGATENTTKVDSEEDVENGKGTGTTTFYDPDANESTESGATVPAEASLAHEFSHMEDASTGTRDVNEQDGLPRNEIKGVRFENLVRPMLGVGPRTTYNYHGKSVDVPNPTAAPSDPWP